MEPVIMNQAELSKLPMFNGTDTPTSFPTWVFQMQGAFRRTRVSAATGEDADPDLRNEDAAIVRRARERQQSRG